MTDVLHQDIECRQRALISQFLFHLGYSSELTAGGEVCLSWLHAMGDETLLEHFQMAVDLFIEFAVRLALPKRFQKS